MIERRWFSYGIALAAIVVAAAVDNQPGQAHKLISSKYTYNDDIFPILRDRCGRCHAPEGVAPMSLMDYKSTYPWGESLRAELVTKHMPPWNAEEGIGVFKNPLTITAPEIDKVMTWASGGTPEGNPLNPPHPVSLKRDWPLGEPDLILQIPSTYTMGADQSDTTAEFTLQTHINGTRWLRAVDVLPGTPAIVRSALVSVKGTNPPGTDDLSAVRLLAAWLPGEDPAMPVAGGFRVPASAEFVVRIHYKKTYQYDGKEMTDRSSVGLYFSPDTPQTIDLLTVASEPGNSMKGAPTAFRRTLNEDVTALAVSPDPSLSNARLQITAIDPEGTRTPIVNLSVRPDWTRRYWFAQPLTLRRGSQIEVTAVINGADELLPPAASPTPAQSTDGPVRVLFDVIRTTATTPSAGR